MKTVTASTAQPGVDYRVPRRSAILRGVVFTFPTRPQQIVDRLLRKGEGGSCREVSILASLKAGCVLAHRHRWGNRAETGERYVIKQLVALPADLALRPLSKPTTKRRKR